MKKHRWHDPSLSHGIRIWTIFSPQKFELTDLPPTETKLYVTEIFKTFCRRALKHASKIRYRQHCNGAYKNCVGRRGNDHY
jgi:hypothetical protein